MLIIKRWDFVYESTFWIISLFYFPVDDIDVDGPCDIDSGNSTNHSPDDGQRNLMINSPRSTKDVITFWAIRALIKKVVKKFGVTKITKFIINNYNLYSWEHTTSYIDKQES